MRKQRYSTKADMWALGCVLYELTTLRHAFDAKDMQGLAMKIVRGKYPPIPSSYAAELSQIVAALLHTTPAQRPSATALLQKPILQQALRSSATGGISEIQSVPPAPPAPPPRQQQQPPPPHQHHHHQQQHVVRGGDAAGALPPKGAAPPTGHARQPPPPSSQLQQQQQPTPPPPSQLQPPPQPPKPQPMVQPTPGRRQLPARGEPPVPSSTARNAHGDTSLTRRRRCGREGRGRWRRRRRRDARRPAADPPW